MTQLQEQWRKSAYEITFVMKKQDIRFYRITEGEKENQKIYEA